MSSEWLSMAYTLTSTASRLTSFGFGAAKASTRLAFSIARSIASVTPIPLLSSSLDRLECLSLLPILLGESIASTSFEAVSNLLDANDEASFSLEAFVGMVRKEWEEHERAGRSVTEVARAVAAWAAIQSFTKQWSEERLLKGTIELTHRDFKPPDRVNGDTESQGTGLRRTINKVSVTGEVITPGQLSQVISADIGKKVIPVDIKSLAAITSTGMRPRVGSNGSELPVPIRSNYETWKTLRRLSKMVLAGYGGAPLIFFGTPLQPTDPRPKFPQSPGGDNRTPHASLHKDSEVKDTEKNILIHAVEGAEAEDLSPPMWNMPFKNRRSVEQASNKTSSFHHTGTTNSIKEHRLAPSSSSYSWWNVLLGKHDREIFEGFAFTAVDESDKGVQDTHSLEPSSPCRSRFHSLSSCKGNPFIHDRSTITSEGSHKREAPKPPTAIVGNMRHMPRFWVLTDHGRRQVVLIVRGTMSFNELAADLTCAPEGFQPATASSPALSTPVDENHPSWPCSAEDVCLPQTSDIPSAVPFPIRKFSSTNSSHSGGFVPGFSPHPNSDSSPRHHRTMKSTVNTESLTEDDPPSYQVHGGMLRLARAMGSKGKPVHRAVVAALSRNRGYELILCGHSLGAGVAGLLALMWTDPTTCLTVPASGLPPNRRVSVYCFAPPCITSASLSRLCGNLITSIVYSFDVVSRLSLGSIQDLNRAALWLCEGQGEESAVNLLRRALKDKLGFGDTLEDTEDEKQCFIAVRKRLEDKMSFTHLYPPGRTWWAVRDESLHPSHQCHGTGLRLYEVQQVEDVFRQIEFKGDMLSSHLPHQYDRMLTELEF